MKTKRFKSLKHLLIEIGSDVPSEIPHTDHYLVDFNQMHTNQLLTLYRNITVFDEWLQNLKRPRKLDKNRIWYLKQVNKFLKTDFKIEDEIAPETLRLMKFFKNKDHYGYDLKEILDTRENIPSKKQKKKIRRLKAEGRYVID